MSDLNPTKIFNGFKKKELDKASAWGHLVAYIENSNSNKLRAKAIRYIGELDCPEQDTFKFLESIVVSDSSELARAATVKVIIHFFLEKSSGLIKWMIKNDQSIKVLYEIQNSLKRKNTSFSQKCLVYLDENISEESRAILNELPIVHELKSLIRGKPTIIRRNGHIINIILKDCMLSEVPEILPKFKSLIGLSLMGNEIKEIKGLEDLSNLLSLDLSKNRIQEIKGLEKLQKLERLSLGSNQIKEITGLKTLINLKSLQLEKNNITEIKNISYLYQLDYLNLSHNEIWEINGLSQNKHLINLHLESNQIKSFNGIDSLAKTLQTLDVSNNLISKFNKAEREVLDSLENTILIGLDTNKIPQEQLDKFFEEHPDRSIV